MSGSTAFPSRGQVAGIGVNRRSASIFTTLLLATTVPGGILPAPVRGQEIEGRVVAHPGGEPVSSADVHLLGESGVVVHSTVSDDRGYFHILSPHAGDWRITAEHLGYGSAGPVPIAVAEGEVVTVELQLTVEPLPMSEMLVVVDRRHVNLHIRQFHRRRREGERTGMGHYLHGEELESRGSARPSDVLRTVPGIMASRGSVATGQIVRMRAGCIPDVYLDGMHVNRMNWAESLDPYVNTSDIEGIEVYRGTTEAGGYYDPDGCGLILVWTRNPAVDSGEKPTWTRWAIGIGMLLGLWLLQN